MKRNAVAGRRFASWAEFTAHLERWSREIADRRATGEQPILRFKDEAPALRPLGGRAPFGQLRDLVRKVRSDCVIDLDTNSYSVPWRLAGETVQVVVQGGRVRVRHAGKLVADHPQCAGRSQRVLEREHFAGLISAQNPARQEEPAPSLLRPLAEV